MELNKVYNEDCLDTMKRMPDGFVDLVVTSPPYNMRLRVRDGKYTTYEKGDRFSKKYEHFGDDLPIDVFYETHKKILHELLRVSKTVIWNMAIVTGSKEALFQLIGHFAKNIKDVAVWDKGHGEPAMHGSVMNRATELIFIMEKNASAGRAFNNSFFERGKLNDIWRSGRGKSIKEHGAVMPEKIAGIAIQSFSKEGDLVYDPFGGMGTTAVVANRYNRNWIISEVTNEYFQKATKNIKKHTDQTKLF